jgi:spore coat protein CotF
MMHPKTAPPEIKAALRGWLQYEIEMTMFIYRAMFDPNFCKPADSQHG